ncbi:MAG: histidine phosphotransferase [Alphaproteobacteria bacterium]|nr:histidine phosphotransferase [Alphaproteobacteria bacterium]
MLELNLIAYLSSRLCHDLVGPIGALANGVEILADEDDPEMRREATELLAASAAEASRRLQYFRMAFGALGGLGERAAMAELRRAASGYFETGRTQLVFPAELVLPAELPKTEAKLLLNLLLVAQAALPRGGQVEVTASGGDGFAVGASGPGARIEPSLALALQDRAGEIELNSHNAVAAYAARLAGSVGGRLQLETPVGDHIGIRFMKG